MNRAELKAEAKENLRGNWSWAAFVGVLITVINGIIFSPQIKTVIEDLQNFNSGQLLDDFTPNQILDPGYWSGRLGSNVGLGLLSGFFMLSMVVTFLNFSRGRKLPVLKATFSVFTDNRFIPEFLNYLLSYLFQYLWTFLLLIPGIVKSYSYALTPYIVNDLVESGQEVHATTGITASRRLMAGHKWELFKLDLSFIGWTIIALIPFGLGLIWLTPYIQTTRANFYRKLAGDQFTK
ncbi:DUF975 family protein [Lactobacillus xylocopicola]|uniref:Membrane protein n=1 Tax=Lactobacillus xylocopicola TaxID=2976676 RepID=A0ABN6SN51_9LACO|nr:DUF975 family protein [Lactobacillus xylocopicola]BDR61218.1 membrane protein [Lactobacillus xylocopicola]